MYPSRVIPQFNPAIKLTVICRYLRSFIASNLKSASARPLSSAGAWESRSRKLKCLEASLVLEDVGWTKAGDFGSGFTLQKV
jgi:hypothetical protein